MSLTSPALAGGFLSLAPPGKPMKLKVFECIWFSYEKKMCSGSYANYLGELGQVTLALWTLPSLSIKTNKRNTR